MISRSSTQHAVTTVYQTDGGHFYLFLWRSDEFGALCTQLARLASRPELDFHWVDGVKVYRDARRQLEGDANE